MRADDGVGGAALGGEGLAGLSDAKDAEVEVEPHGGEHFKRSLDTDDLIVAEFLNIPAIRFDDGEHCAAVFESGVGKAGLAEEVAAAEFEPFEVSGRIDGAEAVDLGVSNAQFGIALKHFESPGVYRLNR